jgi:inner membrane protein
MDNVTHTLTGLALSHAGLNRKTRFATLAIVVGANLPDIDIVSSLGGGATYLKYHRGITHSILGVMVLGVLLAAVVYYVGRRSAPAKSGPPLSGGWLLGVCLIATSSHLALDFTNAYGVRPFLPFSGRWIAWDILYIVDPFLLCLLTAGFVFPMILRLVSEEVGAKKPSFRRGAIFGLCSLALLCVIRDFAHRRVLAQLDSHSYSRELPLRLGAFPSPANPLLWTGVVETDSAFHVLAADVLTTDVDAESARVFHKAERSPALDRAMQTRTAVIFADFARFLWTRVDEREAGFSVTLRDLRFLTPNSPRRGFVAEIDLDKDLRVRSESFSFSAENRKSEY